MLFAQCVQAARRACLLVCLMIPAATVHAVGVGDVAVIYYTAPDPDALAFVALREIPAGTVIRFTDSGWFAAGGFRANEGGIQFTAGADIPPGTVVLRAAPFTSGEWSLNHAGVGGSSFALATAGDQILTFMGSASSAFFLHAVNFDSAGFSDATSSNTTALPPSLTEGVSAVDLGESDSGYYDGPMTGTPEELFAAINDAGNWVHAEGTLNPPAWSFEVLQGEPVLRTVSIPAGNFPIGAQVSVSVELSEPPQPGSPVTVELTSGALAAPVQFDIAAPAVDGAANVIFANEGVWTLTATAIAGGTGDDVTDSFVVGSPLIPPTAFAGNDRSVQLVADTVAIALDEATANDADGLSGVTYAWTPASAAGILGWQNRTGAVNTPTAPSAALVTFNAVGDYVLTLSVTDADELTTTDVVVVHVNPPTAEEEYDAPAGYYSAATGVGPTLKSQLNGIISTGHVQQTYGAIRTNAAKYDADPAVPGNILLVYDRASVPAPWDNGATWNREHVWPQSLQPGEASDSTKGNLGDPFSLRPATPSVNGARGNKPYGNIGSSGGYAAASGGFFFPGDADKGDIARSLFYSATRYLSTHTLVNGTPVEGQMGDLASLLRWHYTDTPDSFERRRNQKIYEDQFNRNPYIDHPEFAWSVYGDGANDSRLYVGATEPGDGASVTSIGFAPIITGGPLPLPVNVHLHKAGLDPTYFAVNVTGEATSSVRGRFNAFDMAAQQRLLQVGLGGSSSVIGLKTGSVVVDNLDVCSEGAGRGSADGDDVIELALAVLDHAEASFSPLADENALTIGFGTVASGAGLQQIAFTVHNLDSPSGYTAALAISSVSASGDTFALATDAGPVASISAGGSAAFMAEFDPSAGGAGGFSATFVLHVADETLPGATVGADLVLTLKGVVGNGVFPFDDDGDGDVDALDLVNFTGCLAGPGAGAGGACANHDADSDGDVDLADAALLQSAFTGSLP